MNGSGHESALLLLLATLPYLFVMVRIISGLTRLKKWNSNVTAKTRISVVIATNKNADNLIPLLNDLACQTYDHDLFEVVISDDSEGLLKADQLQQVKGLNYKIVSNPGKGKKSAMKHGIKVATGELIINTDDDCRVGPRWICTIESFFVATGSDMILCPIELEDSGSHFNRLQQIEFFSLQGVTAGSASINDPLMCNGAGLAFRRDTYPENGMGKSESAVSGDDVFFLHHLKRAGSLIKWLESDDAKVSTSPSADMASFIRQRARWSSKAGFYKDTSTIVTGISVVLLSLAIVASLIMGVFSHTFLVAALLLYLIKTIPDLVIIQNRLKMHRKEKLMWYFPVAQIIYPFYILITVTAGSFMKNNW